MLTIFLWLKLRLPEASRGTRDYGLVLLWPACLHPKANFKAVDFSRRFSRRKKDWQHNKETTGDNLYFAAVEARFNFPDARRGP
jgi:hypothetical protein